MQEWQFQFIGVGKPMTIPVTYSTATSPIFGALYAYKGKLEQFLLKYFRKNGLVMRIADVLPGMLATLVVYLLAKWWLAYSMILPEQSYFEPVLFWELLSELSLVPALLFAGLAAALLYHFQDRLLVGWQDLDDGRRLRLFVTLCAALLAWPFAGYSYNYFYDQAHFIDRLLLVALCLAVYWKPIFVIPFMMQLTLIIGQFNYPLGIGLSRSIDDLPYHILIAFSAVLLCRSWSRRPLITRFLFLSCCLMIANYWWPGFGKLKLNWLTHGHLYYLPVAAYTHGWLAFLAPESIIQFSQTMALLDWPGRLAVFFLECGAILFLWRRGLAKVFILGWIAMHLGIFLICGYLFWQWILLEAVLFFLLFKPSAGSGEHAGSAIFSLEYFLMSILLIAALPRWYQPAKLAWYDTRLSYQFQFEAIADDGRRYSLSPEFFAPYDDLFAFGRFSYLCRQPQLVSAYGATNNRATAERLQTARTPEAIRAFEATLPPETPHREYGRRFEKFVSNFVGNFNRRADRTSGVDFIPAAPTRFWTFNHGETPAPGVQLRQVIVRRISALYTGTTYEIVDNFKIRDIEIR